jgi:hypothetical protein
MPSLCIFSALGRSASPTEERGPIMDLEEEKKREAQDSIDRVADAWADG